MAMSTTSPGRGANGSQAKTNKSSSYTAFAPGFTVNVNTGSKTAVPTPAGGGGGAGAAHRDGHLPEPYFTSPADIRSYCNHLRALGIGLSFEVSMGAEILKATLETVPDPEGRPFGAKLRARKVARKMRKSADALKDAAVNAAACYAAFQQEFEEEINRVRHRARRPQGPRMDWARQ
ncbi:plasmid transfer protein TraA [Streptomyces clavuligerus]|uniref:Putative sporulation-related protein n=1 Tax=Streptomyces clavuligerus TaxID=1901 RepID=E2Q6L0_STRCL|nr:sporulation protein SsgA [Streptomyces clavuligerus]EFG09309.1 Putative sporulation-related protein [Streptomyces clavuligerus]